jgi:hypothetical protein
LQNTPDLHLAVKQINLEQFDLIKISGLNNMLADNKAIRFPVSHNKKLRNALVEKLACNGLI